MWNRLIDSRKVMSQAGMSAWLMERFCLRYVGAIFKI